MWRKSSSCYKFFLLMFNLVFVVSGLILMSVGLVIRGQYHKYHDFLNEQYFSLPIMLICISLVMVVITFFGFCGAIQESSCMISMFAAMLTILFVMETTLGFTAYTLSENTHNVLRRSLNDTMRLYNKSMELTQVWDGLQDNLKCCGMDSYEDWFTVLDDSIPMSCCTTSPGMIGHIVCNENSPTLHKSPCLDTLAEIIKDNASTLGGIGISIAMTQFLGIFFACVLSKRIKSSYENFD